MRSHSIGTGHGSLVASYALFGDAPFYRRHLPALVRAHHALFPEWQLRIHHDQQLAAGAYGRALREMAAAGLVRLVEAGRTPPLTLGMLWRMRPCWEAGVQFNLCRDIDALPTPRERLAVQAFMDSGAAVHCINDHPLHNSVMMGGLVGFRLPEFITVSGLESFDELVALGGGAAAQEWGEKGYDQTVLSERVWPRVAHAACAHRLRTPRHWPQSEPVAVLHRKLQPGTGEPFSGQVLAAAERLAPFIGVDGYEVEPAVRLYSQVVDPMVLDLIRRCEALDESVEALLQSV